MTGELVEQVISAWAFAHNIDGAARNDLFARLRASISEPVAPVSEMVELIRTRAKQRPSDGLIARQNIDEAAIRYGQALLSALADEIERAAQASTRTPEAVDVLVEALQAYVDAWVDVGRPFKPQMPRLHAKAIAALAQVRASEQGDG